MNKALAVRVTHAGVTDEVVVHRLQTRVNGVLVGSGATAAASSRAASNGAAIIDVSSWETVITVPSSFMEIRTRGMGREHTNGFVQVRMLASGVDFSSGADMCSRQSTDSPFLPVATHERIFPPATVAELEAECGSVPTAYPTLYCGHRPTVDATCAAAGLTAAAARQQCTLACPCAPLWGIRDCAFDFCEMGQDALTSCALDFPCPSPPPPSPPMPPSIPPLPPQPPTTTLMVHSFNEMQLVQYIVHITLLVRQTQYLAVTQYSDISKKVKFIECKKNKNRCHIFI